MPSLQANILVLLSYSTCSALQPTTRVVFSLEINELEFGGQRRLVAPRNVVLLKKLLHRAQQQSWQSMRSAAREVARAHQGQKEMAR